MNVNGNEDGAVDLPIVRDFDKLCFEFGDRDAILMHGCSPVSYFEIQEHSKALAYQIYHRFGWPDYILLDCQESPAAEAVATLSCMRIRRPFVPVSSKDQHRPGRMNIVVDMLLTRGKEYSCREYEQSREKAKDSCCHHQPSIVAVVVCENDRDPLLSVFQQAGVHRILYLDANGGMRECLSVPESIRSKDMETSSSHDDMYVMFTSGTTATKSQSVSSAKAVIGSHRATHARLRWFLDAFSSSPRIGRRTKLTFVDGVTELWGALLDPMNLIVSTSPTSLRAKGVLALVEDMECTQLLLLPSQVNQLLLASSKTNFFWKLDRIIVSGEVCPAILWEKLQTRFPKIQLINLYGQTETTGDCLCAVLTDLGDAAIVNNVVAVGRPIVTDVQISLLDDFGDERNSSENGSNDDDGQHGHKTIQHRQLVIKGSQLSNGYLGASSPFDEFHSGDVGFSRNGIWYVRGRIGDVRKINGVLTSLSEVESAFCKSYSNCGISGVVAVMIGNKVNLLCTNEDVVNRFSRLHMHTEEGIPLNLIPNRVFYVLSIPRSASGAKKIDRKACLRLVQRKDQNKETSSLSVPNEAPKRRADRPVLSITASVLGVNECDIDSNKSFVELGGDSASSITLLYRLKQEVSNFADFTATDILWCESLNELENLVLGALENPKRLRGETTKPLSRPLESKMFVPKTSLQINSWHRSVPFLACVDSSPVILEKSIISACHGGVIMRFGSATGVGEGCRYYPGWMFQADMVHLNGSGTVLACGYSLSNAGIVICLTHDLQKEQWKLELDDPIKTRPVVVGDGLWVLSGHTLVGLDLRSGRLLNRTLKLPRSPCTSNPIVIQGEDGEDRIVFASSYWEGGIIVVDTQKMESKVYADCEIGPVHKDMCTTANAQAIFISDSYGSLHVLTFSTMQLSASIHLSSNPLTAITVIGNNTIIVGSYNGKLYCIKHDGKKGHLEKLWECDCYSSIYSKPLDIQDGSITICTTAGCFFKINAQNGEKKTFYKIPAEIWSSPVKTGQGSLIVAGARDSSCHLVSI